MKFRLEFETDNAAFEGDQKLFECARILRRAADQLFSGRGSAEIRDVNGNLVGAWSTDVEAVPHA